ncbi:hypothetical protein K9N68_33745 [Kovacikia minuta CCNUW1]|uniref:hypothetical protein n=1 Tax=Kovacikia minuta TaxID=2931930 RepID=UPI001CCBB7DC|nr:hypothetical protein [Kovacikia minuta]UBF26407.1 hypothetical protein K9N68_33745 [Kovacikia minuta CCNUW1]
MNFRTIVLGILVCSTFYSTPLEALARGKGGHGSFGRSVSVRGYYRKDGTYVRPHMRSAPGSGQYGGSVPSYSSGYSVETDSSPNPTSSYVEPSTTTTDERSNVSTSPIEAVNKPNFPQVSCGDQSTSDSNTWYPVFVDGGDLSTIQQQFCSDAVSTVREDTKIATIQVASFTAQSRAVEFARLIHGDVGQPTYLNRAEPKAEQTLNNATVPTAKPNSVSAATNVTSSPADTSNTQPKTPVSTSPVSTQTQEQSTSGIGQGIIVALTMGLIGFGVGLKARKNT